MKGFGYMEKEKQENFIMLPNKLVWDYKKGNDTYLAEYGDKIVHIFSFLEKMKTVLGKTYFTIEHMITDCGMTPKKGTSSTNKSFRNILTSLKSKGIIMTSVDMDTVRVSTQICCKFNMPIDKDKDNKNTRFFPIAHSSYLRIMDSYDGERNRLILLKVFFYINARLKRRSQAEKDIGVTDGKSECFYDSYSNVCYDLEMSEATYNEHIKELQEIGVLFYNSIGLVKKGSAKQIANNVYVIDEKELKEALEGSKKYYKTNGYSILGKKSNQNEKLMNGVKGKIKQLRNIGTDTLKLEEKLSDLEKEKLNVEDTIPALSTSEKLNTKQIINAGLLHDLELYGFDIFS